MRKIICLFISILLMNTLISCGVISSSNPHSIGDNSYDVTKSELSNENSEIIEVTAAGKNSFIPDNSADFEVIFFDTDNIISANGKSFENVISDLGCINNASDCYMIKSGNCEILVDCGNQNVYGVNTVRQENFCKNIVRKILTYCSDGILDYLIVTHADQDHIKYLTLEGCLFDMIIDYDKWFQNYYTKLTGFKELTTVYNDKATPITKILNIIDFDSYRVRTNSSDENNNNLLISTQIYRDYVKKRDSILAKSNETSYSPAGYLFSEVTGDTKDTSFHNHYAIPSSIYDKVYKQTNGAALKINLRTLVSKNYTNSINNQPYKMHDLSHLMKIETENGVRYTYDFNINDEIKLKILYNWYYDNYYQKTFDSQSKNDISVSFLIESKNAKFLALGDLGGDGESGILNYYKDTNVLKNITCFKASHHGSTHNNENSASLFERISSSEEIIVVITGVLQPSRKFFEEPNTISKNQTFYNSLKTVPMVSSTLFENLININCEIYCTQTVTTNNFKNFYSCPLYGDIHVSFKNGNNYISYSYSGDIKSFIQNIDNDIDKSLHKFKTDSNSLINLELLKKLNIIKSEE